MRHHRRFGAPALLVLLALVLTAAVQSAGANPLRVSGGGGAPPDITLTKTVSAATATVGDTLTYTIVVFLKSDAKATAIATRVIVTDTLPSGLTLVSTRSDRGTGSCEGTTTLTCNVDYINGAAKGTITIVTRAAQAGTIVNTASVTEHQGDPDLKNNSASATTTVAAAPPPPPPPPTASHPGPPRLVRSGPATLQASRSGRYAELSFRAFVDEPATLVAKAGGRALVPGSRLGAVGLEASAAAVTATLDRAKVVRVKLRFDAAKLVKGKAYQATVQATDRDGQSSTLTVPFRC